MKLKLADISPTHKNDDDNDKKNYRPLNILLFFSLENIWKDKI